MQVAMVRIGVDTGCGGIHGPLFKDSTFEYIPIPDGFGIDDRTYGNTVGRYGRKLVEYFPQSQQSKMEHQAIHFDPEFDTFTYGDPTSPKSGLRRLQAGDYLIFYCGLQGWDTRTPPALYLMGYFEVAIAGYARELSVTQVHELFGGNYHVRHKSVYEQQKDNLVLVRGSPHSRLLNKAVKISVMGKDRAGKPLKILSPEMQEVFGGFGGKVSFQRSPTRWVDGAHTKVAIEFIKSLV